MSYEIIEFETKPYLNVHGWWRWNVYTEINLTLGHSHMIAILGWR
jgi:hypothetical protein